MPQYTAPFTNNPETVQVPDKQVQEDHLNGLPVRLMNASGNANSSANPLFVSDTPSMVGTTTATVATNNAAAAIKSSAGTLFRATITTTGTAAATTLVNFYDNASAASGTVLGSIPGNATAGTQFSFLMPAANGIYVGAGALNTPAFTVSYA